MVARLVIAGVITLEQAESLWRHILTDSHGVRSINEYMDSPPLW